MAATDVTGTSLLLVLISVIGGGTLVPLVYRMWLRRSEKPSASKVSAEIDQIATHAVNETFEGMRGTLLVVRQQFEAEVEDNRRLREERKDDRVEIARLRNVVRELRGEPRIESSTD